MGDGMALAKNHNSSRWDKKRKKTIDPKIAKKQKFEKHKQGALKKGLRQRDEKKMVMDGLSL